MDAPLKSSGMPRKRPGCEHKHKHNPLPHIIDLSLNLIWKGVVSKEVKDQGSDIRRQMTDDRGQKSDDRLQKTDIIGQKLFVIGY